VSTLLQVGTSNSSVVWDLGVYMDSELTMKELVAKIADACFYHIRRLCQVRRIGQEVTQQLVLALIMSRLDYCNSVLAALPTSTLQPLQHVQNAAARLVFGCNVSLRPCHTDPDPAALAASQLRNEVQAVLPPPRHPLWSQSGVSDGNSPVSQRQQIMFWAMLIFHLIDGLFLTTAVTKFGQRAFSRAGTATWNALPDHICTVADPVKFRKCSNHTIFAKLLIYVYIFCFLCVLAFG